MPRWVGTPWNFVTAMRFENLEWCRYQIVRKCDDMSVHLDTVSALDGQTDGIAKTISFTVCIACWRAIKKLVKSTVGAWSWSLKPFCRTSVPYAYARFLPRDAMRKRGLCYGPVSVCPSVTLVHCIQTAEDIVKLLSRPDSVTTVVFFWPMRRYQIPREPLQWGRKIQGGGKILRFSTEIAVYLGNGTR